MCLYEVYEGSPLDPPAVAYAGPLPAFAQFMCDGGLRVDLARLGAPEEFAAVGQLLALRLVRVTPDGSAVEPTEAGAYRRNAVRLRGRRYGTCPDCGGAVVWEDESVVACSADGCRSAWLPVLGKRIRQPGVALAL